MKINTKGLLSAILLMVFSITLNSCNKTEDVVSTLPTTTAGMTATVDGASFSSLNGGVTILGNNCIISGSAIVNNVANTITLNCPNALGTYPITSSGTVNFASIVVGGAVNPLTYTTYSNIGGQGGSGTITISSLTVSKMKGTFSFIAKPSVGSTATGQKVITNGIFDLTL